MAITSVGYSGQIGWVEWAQMARSLGTDYGIVGVADLAVTIANAAAGTVTVAAGSAHGCGVVDTLDAPELVEGLTSPNTWYTVVVRRDWTPGPGDEVTTLVALAGSGSQGISVERLTGAGATDDQPIALVHRGASALDQVVDLRCWWGNGGLSCATVAALAYLGRPGSVVTAAGNPHYWVPGTGWVRLTMAQVDGLTAALNTKANSADVTAALAGKANTSHALSSHTGTLAVAMGGTAATNAATARTNLGIADTGWVTTGLSIPAASGWTVNNYRLRKKFGNVVGYVTVTRSVSPGNGLVVANENTGNISDTSVCTMPAAWRSSMGTPEPVQIVEPGVLDWFGRIDTGGVVAITHGIPNAFFSNGTSFRIYFNHLNDT